MTDATRREDLSVEPCSAPLVSILIPCRHAEKWLADAIESALAQTWSPKEVLVYDDASTDRSVDVARSFGDRVSSETGASRLGAVGARNRLIAASRGQWLQFLDADDLLMPDKLERQLALAASTPCDLVVSPAAGEDGHVINAPVSEDPWINLFHFGMGVTSANLHRRQIVLAAGGWAGGAPGPHDDYRMAAAELRAGARVLYDPTPRAVYRKVNPSSATEQVGIAAGYLSFCALIREWTAALDVDGQLTAQRRHEGALAALRMARRLWDMDRPLARQAAALALAVEPDLLTRMRGRWPVYAAVFRSLGFGAAQRYDAVAATLRSALGRRAAGAGGTWS